MAIKRPQQSSVFLHDLRAAIAACIEDAVVTYSPNAQIHSHWAMSYSVEETIEILTGADGVLHGWMVDIDQIIPSEKGIGARVGGGILEIPLNVRIYGFIGRDFGLGSSSNRATLEKDCINIIKTIYLNEIDLGNPALASAQNVLDVGLLEFEEIELRSFGSGHDVLVAEGNLPLTWREVIQEV